MITDKELVDRATEVLGEHFDEVVILVSRMTQDGKGFTERIFVGKGNWFARKGMARDFLDRDDKLEAATMIAEKMKE